MTKLWTALAALAVSLPATAFSAEINLTDPAIGSDINGAWTTSYSMTDPETGVEVTIESQGGVLWQDGSDGIGILNYADDYNYAPWGDGGDDWMIMGDEIDQQEKLIVNFSEAVTIEKIAITDLYDEGYIPMVNFYAPDEAGQWRITDMDGNVLNSGNFYGEQDRYVSNGNLTVDLGGLLAETLELVSLNNSQFKGFSVASITFSTKSVPELGAQGLGASAFLLFGAALLLSDRRRRQLGIEHA
jgi:hypothetical protein